MRRRSRALVASALLTILASCVGPARTYDDFRLKAKSAAESARSAVGTAQLAVKVARERRGYVPYIVVLVVEAERDASGAQTAFDSVQPPNARADRLRDDADKTLTAATSVLATLRISARRGDLDDFARHAPELDKVAADLDRFVEAQS
jgi:hypothetical protein